MLLRFGVEDADLGPDAAAWRSVLGRDLARSAMLAGFALVVFDLARLWHQTFLFFGGFEPITLEIVGTIANQTLWGSGWKVQTISAALAAVGFAAALRGWPAAGPLTAAAALTTAMSRPLTGHAAEQGSWLSLPAILQSVHVVAAAAWIGTLAAMLFFGLRHAARLSSSDRARAVAAIVTGFSPIGLTAATALFIAGSATSFIYLGSAKALFGTTYGLLLIAKVVAFATVAAVGFFNWQRVRPALDAGTSAGGTDDGAAGIPEALLWRSASLELGLAVIVLLLTAVLVSLPMPMG